MRVFVAGASGVLGRNLVPLLVRRGHQVVGTTRTKAKRGLLERLGARPVVADALDPDAVEWAVRDARPEVVVHQLTAIPASINPRRMERDFARPNRLRREATDNLLSAGQAIGIRRFVAQSFAGYFARTGGSVKDEEDPLDPEPPATLQTTLAAIRYLEQAVTGAEGVEGIVLRYGAFYGAGTTFGRDPPGDLATQIRRRMLPIVGGGTGVWSFIHVEDAAEATANAVERGAAGVYLIADDDPAPAREWLPVAAEALGAKPPLRVPRWLGRLAAGEVAVIMMTEARGASNAKAKREFAWQPRYPSWRQGFFEG